MRPVLLLSFLSAILLGACSSKPAGRSYDVHGQIVALQRADGIVTLRHDDIKGFMPAMTMPFKVKDKKLLEGREVGDLVNAKLFVTGSDAYLTSIQRIGHSQVVPTAGTPVPRVPILEKGEIVPDVEMIDSRGRKVRFSALGGGKAVALTFIYTRCPMPQFCPLMNRQFSAVSQQVKSGKLDGKVSLLSISFDPEYDTPAVLTAHARAVGADGVTWKFVTADRRTIEEFAARFGVVLMRDDPNVITHNLRTAIVDRQGRVVKIYDGNDWTPDQLYRDLVSVVGQT